MYSIAFVISLVVFNQITISEASVCDYCKYCDYCGHCSECPCEKKKHCNLCSYCKYCSFCGACKTMCSEDSWIQQSLAALGWTSLENLETDEVKKDLEGVDFNKIRKKKQQPAKKEEKKEKQDL